jgi:Tfp pilus assembly protein PilO
VNKISKTKKQQMVLVLVAASLVIAGLWFYVIKAQKSKLAVIQKKTLEIKDKVEKAEVLLKRTEEIELTLEADIKALETIEGEMASGDLYLWMINTLNRFNSLRRVTLLDYQRETIGEVGILPKFPYRAATFPVKGIGHYHDLGKFLAEFENSFPYARIQNLELMPAPAKTGSDDAEKLNFKFEIVMLVKPAGQN